MLKLRINPLVAMDFEGNQADYSIGKTDEERVFYLKLAFKEKYSLTYT